MSSHSIRTVFLRALRGPREPGACDSSHERGGPVMGLRAGLACLVCWVMTCTACGSDPVQSDPDGGDAAVAIDAQDDASSGMTRVTALLGGTTVVLSHAIVIFDSPLSTLCVSNTPIEPPECGFRDQQNKTVLFGRFGFDGANQPQWAFPVELRKVPGGPVELSSEGTITLEAYTPAEGIAVGSLELTFNSGITQGTFEVR